mmetsp:Transcript_57812/g.161350  ORF Transcript_57812/g.161350 Transcript_57812/m.161350 type:complete len:232 (-) Transcript_57812:2865-3560(-)
MGRCDRRWCALWSGLVAGKVKAGADRCPNGRITFSKLGGRPVCCVFLFRCSTPKRLGGMDLGRSCLRDAPFLFSQCDFKRLKRADRNACTRNSVCHHLFRDVHIRLCRGGPERLKRLDFVGLNSQGAKRVADERADNAFAESTRNGGAELGAHGVAQHRIIGGRNRSACRPEIAGERIPELAARPDSTRRHRSQSLLLRWPVRSIHDSRRCCIHGFHRQNLGYVRQLRSAR